LSLGTCQKFDNPDFTFQLDGNKDNIVSCSWIQEGSTLTEIDSRRNNFCRKIQIRKQCESSCGICCTELKPDGNDQDNCLKEQSCEVLMERPIVDLPDYVQSASLVYSVDIIHSNSADLNLNQVFSQKSNEIIKGVIVGCDSDQNLSQYVQHDNGHIISIDFKSLDISKQSCEIEQDCTKVFGMVDVMYTYINNNNTRRKMLSIEELDLIQKTFDGIQETIAATLDGIASLTFQFAMSMSQEGFSVLEIDGEDDKTFPIIISLSIFAASVVISLLALFISRKRHRNKENRIIMEDAVLDVMDEEVEVTLPNPQTQRKDRDIKINSALERKMLGFDRTTSFPIQSDDSDDWVVATVISKTNDNHTISRTQKHDILSIDRTKSMPSPQTQRKDEDMESNSSRERRMLSFDETTSFPIKADSNDDEEISAVMLKTNDNHTTDEEGEEMTLSSSRTQTHDILSVDRTKSMPSPRIQRKEDEDIESNSSLERRMLGFDG